MKAVNAAGSNFRARGGASQSEALQRIKDMGLFPTRVAERRRPDRRRSSIRPRPLARTAQIAVPLPGGRVKPAVLAAFTRQPSRRWWRRIAIVARTANPRTTGNQPHAQAHHRGNRRGHRKREHVVRSARGAPESIQSPLCEHGQSGRSRRRLETTLQRLAEFMEKAQKIKGRVKSAMFYPAAVMCVAAIIMTVMMVFVVPRFQAVFSGLLDGKPMPAHRVRACLSDMVRHHACSWPQG